MKISLYKLDVQSPGGQLNQISKKLKIVIQIKFQQNGC